MDKINKKKIGTAKIEREKMIQSEKNGMKLSDASMSELIVSDIYLKR